MENTVIIRNANKLLVPTWRWLKLNDSTIACDKTGSRVNIEPQILNLPDKITIEKNVPADFPAVKTGIGTDADEFVHTHAFEHNTITIEENAVISEPVSFIYKLNDNNFCTHADYIHAKKNSCATLIFVYTSPYDAAGLHGAGLKILAEENAQINIIQLQTLGRNFTCFYDIGTTAADSAKITLRQIALGGRKNWLGIHADLKQHNTVLKLNLDYIAGQNQNIDINYVAAIHGQKNNVQITANGILIHNAQKTMRGTLDFKQGCKGSVGNESENVLLLDEDIQNKSIPLILCGEDDIEGNHSASIGEMDEAQLFYLYTRGLSDAQIRRMQIDAKIQLICNDLPQSLHEYVLNYEKNFKEAV